MANTQDTSPSILERVRSRVSGWFSPTSCTEHPGNTNGNLRRRRESDTEPSAEELNEAPPVKKLKSYIVTQNPTEAESRSLPGHHYSPEGKGAGHTSTPTTSGFTSRRTIYDYSARHQEPPYSFLRSSPISRAHKSQLNQIAVPEVDEEDADEPTDHGKQPGMDIEEEAEEEEAEAEESLANGNESASESGASMSSASMNIFPPDNTPGGGRLRQSSVINFGSHLQSKKSLFSDKNISMSMSSLNSLSQKRSFNASLYGSTSALSDSRLLNIQSPFYRGRTMFGGASAYTSHGVRYNSPLGGARQMPPTRPSSSLSNFSAASSAAAANGNEDGGVPLSSTAKRILEVMNQLSGPLSDVRKMAHSSLTTRSQPTLMTPHRQQQQLQRFTEQDMQASRAIRLQQPKTPYSRATTANSLPPITELQVPSMSQLLQMKKLQSQTEQLRKCAAGTKSDLNRVTEYKLPDTKGGDHAAGEGTKHVNKIRNKISKVRESATAVDEIAAPVQLPDIQLPQLKSVPKFDISFPLAEKKKNGTTTATGQRDGFTFSTPIVVVDGSDGLPRRTQQADMVNFTFSEPIDVAGTRSKSSNFNFNPELAKKRPQNTAATDTLLSSSGHIKAAEQTLKVGSSVLEALKSSSPTKKDPKVSDTTHKESPYALTCMLNPMKAMNSFGSQFKAPTDTWECDSCLVRNKNVDAKCVACGGSKKEAAKAPPPTPLISTVAPPVALQLGKWGFSDIVQAQKAKWTCSSCMVQNDDGHVKCACCEQPRPDGALVKSPPHVAAIASAAVPKAAPTDAGFGKLVSEQKAKWECSACMTRNDHGKNRCACCEQPKPGAEADNVPQFSFSAAQVAPKFTFGIVPAAAATATSATTIEKSQVSVTTAPTGGFIFGAAATTTSSTKESEKTVSETPSKGGFVFGGNVTTTTAAATAAAEAPPKFVFGAAAAAASPPKVTTTTEGKFVFGTTTVASTTSVTSTTSGFKFGVPTAVSSTEASATPKAPPTFSFGAKSVVTSISKASEPPPATTTSAAATFSFTPSTGTTATTVVASTTNTSSKTPESKPKASIVFGTPATAVTQSSNIFAAPTPSIFKSPMTFGGETAAKAPPAEEPKKTFEFGGSGSSKTTQSFTFGTQPTVASSTTAAPTKPAGVFAFGAAAEQTSKPAATTFIFGGAAKAQEDKPKGSFQQGFGSGGFSAQTPQSQSTFGSSIAPPTASFGAAAATATPFGGGGAQVNSAGTTPAFGASSTFGAVSSTNLFGATPSFNATPNATTGGIFGDVTNKPAAAVASPFGQAASRGFDVNDGNEPLSKKQQPSFDFGAPKATDTANAPFTFGANNNNAPAAAVEKAAFNFTAGAAPNFNFTGSGQQNTAQPFSFNATSSPFNFDAGSSETGGTNAPAFPIGTNLFAATPGQAPRRKMRAVRRIQR